LGTGGNKELRCDPPELDDVVQGLGSFPRAPVRAKPTARGLNVNLCKPLRRIRPLREAKCEDPAAVNIDLTSRFASRPAVALFRITEDSEPANREYRAKRRVFARDLEVLARGLSRTSGVRLAKSGLPERSAAGTGLNR